MARRLHLLCSNAVGPCGGDGKNMHSNISSYKQGEEAASAQMLCEVAAMLNMLSSPTATPSNHRQGCEASRWLVY